MLKKILIAMIAMLMVVLLTVLVRESRTVDAQFYLDYSNYVSALRQSQRDHETLASTLSVYAGEAQALPETVASLAERLGAGVSVLRAPPASIRDAAVAQSAAVYTSSVEKLLAGVAGFSEVQERLADAANVLRGEGPAVVRSLRERGQEPLSQSLFALTVDVLDYATGKSTIDVSGLETRLDAMVQQADEAGRAPAGLAALLDASRTVLTTRTEALDALNEVDAADFPSAAQRLYGSVSANNARVTSRADRARLLLGGVAGLMLLLTGFALVRLRQSNEQLNDTNAELEQFNISLEERVGERTRELSSAYSELKESQAQLVQAEKMSSLGELVAGISHEINTPLWYLLSNTTLIKERLSSFNQFVSITDDMLGLLRAGGADKDAFVKQLRRLDHALNQEGMRDDLEECNDLLNDSSEGLEQLSEMAQSLKDFSRLDRAATDKVNLNDGVDRTLVIAKNVLKGGIEVRKNLGDLPPVTCSPSQINQVLLNLIKNAADAMGRDGVLTITTWAENDRALISVKDTGEGMDEDTLSKIRDPFFTTKEVGKGTGLGLSISQKIIDAHDGSLDIQSQVGKGSTFTISLPVGTDDGMSDMARELEELEALTEALESGQLTEGEGDLAFPAEKTA
ncbi:MAG: ATP-binding protein [Pseudomonadota bacterium]